VVTEREGSSTVSMLSDKIAEETALAFSEADVLIL